MPRELEYHTVLPILRSEGEKGNTPASETRTPKIEPAKEPDKEPTKEPADQPIDQTKSKETEQSPAQGCALRTREPIDYHKADNPAARKPGVRFIEPAPVSPVDRPTIASAGKTRERAQFARQVDPVHEIIN